MTMRPNERGAGIAAALVLFAQVGIARAEPPIPSGGGAAATRPSPDQRVVISLGDERITAAEFAAMVGDLPPAARAAMNGPHRRAIVEDLLKAKMLAHEARRRGIDRSPKFQRQMSVVRDQVLADMLQNQIAADATDAALQQFLDAHPADFSQLRVRHILVRTPDSPFPPRPGQPELTDAQARARAASLRQRVTAGAEDFAAVAAKESDEPPAASSGGALRPFGPGGAIDPAVERAAQVLRDGEVSEPVRTAYGYHVIKLEQRFVPPLDKVRADVASAFAADQVQALRKDLRASLNVTIDDSVFGPPQQQAVGRP